MYSSKSTGKEANVYHASTSEGEDRAVKIYKTSILVFKDRDKYVTGEYRFRHGYCKGDHSFFMCIFLNPNYMP